MSLTLTEPPNPYPLKKPTDLAIHSHSTISEKLSSEENELKIRSYKEILNDFNDNDEETLERFIIMRSNEEHGEIDLEFALMKFDKTPKSFDPVIRKTSFFYLKNRDSYVEKTHKTSFSGSGVFDKEKNLVKPCLSKKGTLQSRRVSINPLNSKNSKNERIESLAKIQSDLINKIFRQNEKSYNFTVAGRKYQFAENAWFFFSERNPFRKKIIILFKSSRYKQFILFVCLINFVAYVIYDYSPRIGHDASRYNWTSWALELLCTIIFTFDFFLRSIGMGLLLGRGTLLKSFFGCYYLLILIASWMIYLPDNELTTFWRCIRLLRNNRLIVFITPLKKNMDSFLRSLPSFMKTYMSLLSLMIFYSILGLHMLKGLDENRCRFTQFPVNNNWLADENITNLCGEWACPSEFLLINNKKNYGFYRRYCINPSDHGFPRMENENDIPELNYGLTNFNTIFNSFFTTLHFIDTIGWTSITYNYWKAMNQFASALFFTSIVVFGALIFMNILLATLYESFVSKESIKHSLEKKIKKQNTLKKDQVNLADLTLAKTLKAAPTAKKLKNTRVSIDEGAYEEKVALKLIAQKEKVKTTNKFKLFIIESIESQYFRIIMAVFLIIDFTFLSLDRYPITLKETKMIYLIDFGIFWLFFVEILLRIMAYGPKLYFLSIFNCYDFLIILLNLNQYIYELIMSSNGIYSLNTQTGPIFRILKLFRVYRILFYSNFFKKISLLTKALFKTLDKIKYFMLFVILLTVTSALIGRELFAYRILVLEDGISQSPRINYDNFYQSIISVILSFYNEDWNVVMYENYESVGSSAIIYYMFLIIVGQMTFIILLKALILNYFIKSISKQFYERDRKFTLKALTFIKSKIRTMKSNLSPQRSQLMKNPHNSFKNNNLPRKSEVINQTFKRFSMKDSSILFKRSNTSNANAHAMAKNKRKSFDFNNLKHLQNTSNPEFSSKNLAPLIAMSPRSPSRKKTTLLPALETSRQYQIIIYKILISKYYHYFMFIVTLISMILQILDSSFDSPDSDKEKIIQIIDRILGVIYILEFLMNIVTYGFICGENSYLRQSFYNKLDFCNIIITICDVFVDKYQNRICQSLKIVRTFRILKLATTTTQEIQLISNAFFEAFPNLLVLIIFFSIFLSISSLIATKYMKGTLFHCEIIDYDGEILDKWDCFDNGGDWIDDDITYNNIFSSIMSLFQISSCQGWTALMEDSIDGVGVDLQPKEDYNTAKAVFFLIFFFVSNFILLNMFVGIITENIIINKNRDRGLDKLTEEQREWAIIKANILKLKPKPLKTISDNPSKKVLYLLSKNKYVNIVFDTCIVINLIILMSYHHRQTPNTTSILNSLNYIMIAIFTIENLMKLFLNQKNYFHSKKCLYEGFILLLIWIDIIIQASIIIPETHIQNPYLIFIGIVKGLQATRIYRIFKRIQSVKQIYDSLFHVMPTLLNMLLLIILILYMYAILGMDLFSYLKPQTTINDQDISFSSFSLSFFTLVKVASSETWFLVFADAVRQQQPNFVCRAVPSYYDYEKYGLEGCGSWWAYPFFLSFHILFSLIILNLFVAIVLTHYDDEFKAHQSAINKYQLKGIKEEWRLSDPNGDGYINYKDFWRFSSKIAGFLNIQQSVESKKKFLKLLRIPVYENAKTKIFSYKFHDVIIELSKMSVLVNYGVINLETEEDPLSDILDSEEKIEIVKKNKSFTKTQFFCGDMSSIILISKLLKRWIKKAKKEYDAENAVNDIFDITKIALMRRRTEKTVLMMPKAQLNLKEENQERINEDSPVQNDPKQNEQNSPINAPSSEDAFQRQPPIVMRYNIMNEVTVDEGSMVFSGNRSLDICANSNRPLIEENTRRRGSILKKQYGFGANASMEKGKGSDINSPIKRNPGKKIQFILD